MAHEVSKDIVTGKAKHANDLNYWRERVAINGSFNEYFYLIDKEDDDHEKIKLTDIAIKKFGNASDIDTQIRCAKLLYLKAITLRNDFQDDEGAVSAYTEVCARYIHLEDSWTRHYCIHSLMGKAQILYREFGDLDGAVKLYDQVLNDFRFFDNEDIVEPYIYSMLRKGGLLAQRKESAELAIETYDKLYDLCVKLNIPKKSNHYAGILLGKAWVYLHQKNDPQNTIAICDNFMEAYDNFMEDADICIIYTSSITLKIIALLKIGKELDAINQFEYLLSIPPATYIDDIEIECLKSYINVASILEKHNKEKEAKSHFDLIIPGKNHESRNGVIYFLLWLSLIEADIRKVIDRLKSLKNSRNARYYDFHEIYHPVEKMSEPRKTQAECFIAFFEQHHDITVLEQCLAAVSS